MTAAGAQRACGSRRPPAPSADALRPTESAAGEAGRSSRSGRARSIARGLVVLALGGLLGGCYLDTQRLPGPLPKRVEPLPRGSLDSYPPGPEEVLVVRHADPVQLRPAGRGASYPLTYYRKQERTTAGSWVFVGAGGRGELLWPSGTTVVFFGQGTGIVGSPSRSEPTFVLREVTRVKAQLVEGDRLELIGGGVLAADTGPFLIEQLTPEILRVHNHSKGLGRLAFREERIELDPGNVIDLPLVASGGRPVFADPGFERIDGPAGPLEARGDLGVERVPAGVRFTARGDHEVRGQGVRVEVEPGESVTFRALAPPEAAKGGSAEGPAAAEPAADGPNAGP